MRIGGFRVGAVSRIDPAAKPRARAPAGDRRGASMKLDKSVEPLSADTRLRVRPRSALGVKYVELTPARSRAPPGGRRHRAAGPELGAVRVRGRLRTFDREARPNLRKATEGFGNAFTGRGRRSTRRWPRCRRCSRSCAGHGHPNDPGTDLAGLVRNLGAVAGATGPGGAADRGAGAHRRRHLRGAEPFTGGARRDHRRHPGRRWTWARARCGARVPWWPRPRSCSASCDRSRARVAGHAAADQRRPARGHARAAAVGGRSRTGCAPRRWRCAT